MNMKTMKTRRILCLIAIITGIVIVLCACSKSQNATESENSFQNEGTNIIESSISETKPTEAPTSTPTPTPKPTATPTPTPIPKPTLDVVDSGGKAFRNILKQPCFSFFAAYKNNCDQPIVMFNLSFDYQDNNGKLLATDQMVHCIPQVLKPGQTGYIYTYYYDLTGIDYNNGFVPKLDGDLKWADSFYEIEISDISFKKGWSDYNVEIIGRGTNNTGKNLTWVQVGAVFFDKNDAVLGFCYGAEDFPDGKTTTFSISGDTMSPEIKASDVDHVQVFIQGNN